MRLYFLGSSQGVTSNQITAGKVSNRQWVAVATILQHKLPFVVSTPEFVGLFSVRKRCSPGFVPGSLPALDQAVSIQESMDRTDGRTVNIRILSPEPFSDLGSALVRKLTLEPYDQLLNLHRKLVGMTIGTPAAVR